ncbi:TolC family protein [Terriglobus roseus]|nr:TolC family protein [Terriglobus roseus]
MGAQVLQQTDIEESVRKSYPPLLAAFQEINQANADALAAKGKFDTKLKGKAENNSLGYYENRVADVSVEQPLRWGGADLFGGWRIGQGTFPVYEGKYETRSGGEYRVGARLPLLQDRSIDSRRADLQKTAIGQQAAGLSVEQQRLAIMNSAIQRYWLWVAAGNRLAIARGVLQTAQSRQALLDLGADSGQLPAIDAVDNRRAVLQRQGQVVEATRALQGAALDLSLLYRDAAGDPIVPTESQLPPEVTHNPSPDPMDVNSSVSLAWEKRPDARRVATQRASAEVDLKVARNQKLPDLDLTTSFTSERGTSSTVRRGPQEFRAGVVFELPLQRRQAEGRIQAAQARIVQFTKREQFAKDTIREEVQDAISALTTASQRLRVAQEELSVTRQLEQAERTKFELGEGTLFLLNLREQATLESAVRNVTALADHQRAVAAYRYSMADL